MGMRLKTGNRTISLPASDIMSCHNVISTVMGTKELDVIMETDRALPEEKPKKYPNDAKTHPKYQTRLNMIYKLYLLYTSTIQTQKYSIYATMTDIHMLSR